MVKNKAELLQASNEWMVTAGKDLQKHLKAFIALVRRVRGVDLPIETVSRMFDENPRTIEAVLNGQIANVPMSLFAKLLIASNHAIQIVPVNQTPLPAMGRVARHMGMPHPQRTPQERTTERPRPVEQPQPISFGFMNPIGENLRPTGRVYNPETNSFVPQNETPVPEEPQFPPMGTYPYPMPPQSEMLPDPEDMMEMARQNAMRDIREEAENEIDEFESMDEFGTDELLDERVPNAEYHTSMSDMPENEMNIPEEEVDDNVMELARALRDNPAVADLLRRLV